MECDAMESRRRKEGGRRRMRRNVSKKTRTQPERGLESAHMLPRQF